MRGLLWLYTGCPAVGEGSAIIFMMFFGGSLALKHAGEREGTFLRFYCWTH